MVFTVAVPESAAPAGLRPSVIVTLVIALVTVSPSASSMATWIAGAIGTPAVPTLERVVNQSFVGFVGPVPLSELHAASVRAASTVRAALATIRQGRVGA